LEDPLGIGFPPKISKIIKKNPLGEIISDFRGVVVSAREEVRNLVSALKGKPLEIEEEKEGKPACLRCVRDHLSTATSSLSEGLRFARSGSMGDPEVIKRIEIAIDELNIAERIDLHPSEVEKLPPEGKEVANWVLPRLRNLRHQIEDIKVLGDLEKASAKAFELKLEYVKLLLQCEPCGILSLEDFLKKKRG